MNSAEIKIINDLYSSIKETYETDRRRVAHRTLCELEAAGVEEEDLLVNGCSDLVSDANEFREQCPAAMLEAARKRIHE